MSTLWVCVPSPDKKKRGDLANMGEIEKLGRIQKYLGALVRFYPYSSQKKKNNPRYIATIWEESNIFDIILPNVV